MSEGMHACMNESAFNLVYNGKMEDIESVRYGEKTQSLIIQTSKEPSI